MTLAINRRRLLGASLLVTAAPLKAESLWDWLSSADTPERLHAILVEHLQLQADHLALMPDFIRRLKSEGASTEKPERFKTWLLDHTQIQELEAYVVEEFLIASNYFAWKAGEDGRLCILAALA